MPFRTQPITLQLNKYNPIIVNWVALEAAQFNFKIPYHMKPILPLPIILFLSSLFLACTALSAQVTLSGALSGSYPTLDAAFAAINSGGGSGAVTVSITANHTLTTTAALNQTGYTVTIQPSGNRIISGLLNAPLIRFNGADNVTLDGIALSGANTLTISNTSTGGSASALNLQNDASNNIIRFCSFEGSTLDNFKNGVVNISTPGLGTGGCDNNQIINNNIRDAGGALPKNCVVLEGASASALNDNNIINNNNIYNFFSPNNSTGFGCGVFSYRYNAGTTISGNSFYQTASRTGSGIELFFRPIQIDDGFNPGNVGGFIITNNSIGGSAPSAAGSPLTITHPTNLINFNGIFINAGNTGTSSIHGNTIKNFNFTCVFNKSDYWQGINGIYVGGGNVNVGTTTGNVIGSGTGTGSITVNVSMTGSGGYQNNGINNQSNSPTVAIKNNTVGSITFNPTGSTGNLGFYGIYSWQNDAIQIENNTVGSTSTANSISFGSNTSVYTFATGIMAENSTCSVKNNTVRYMTHNGKGELNGINLWNALAGKTQTCTGNTVKNLLCNSGNTVDVTGIQAISTPTATITYNLDISNNTIADNTVGAGSSGECDLFGIWLIRRGTSPVCFVNGTINNNNISNLNNANTFATAALGGILDMQLYNGTGMTISNNTISNFTATSQTESTIGIFAYGSITPSLLTSATSLTIQGNNISGLTNNKSGTTTVTGIDFNGKNITISKNKVYDLKAPNGNASSVISGLSCTGGSGTGAYQASNNMISLGGGANHNVQFRGILNKTSAPGSLNIWYNSVFIGGTAPSGATSNTACLERQTTASANIRNNVFYNARTGPGSHFSIANTASPAGTGWSSNNNFLVSAQTGTIGLWGATPQTFSGWQAASGGDGASTTAQAFVNTNPASFFVSTPTCNLSVNTANGAEAALMQNKGTPVAVTVDYFNAPRSNSAPDPGAHEFPTVVIPPVANFSANPTTACPGQSILFTDQSLNAPTAWNWSFPGGTPSTSTQQNPLVFYANPGNYNVTLTVTNSAGSNSITKTNFILITPLPTANFTFAVNGNTVNFTNTSANASGYSWNFGDGGTSNQPNPVHTYAAGGAYTVTLVATNNCGTNSTSKTVTIVVASPPIAAFSASPTSGCAPLEVQFSDQSTGGVTSWAWSFPGGNPASSSDQNPVVSYNTPGIYSATLIAGNSAGSDTLVQTDLIVVNDPADADFSFSVNEYLATFNNASANADTYVWDFGDGASSAEENPVHTYGEDGTYDVTLIASNNCSADTAVQQVVIITLPVANFSADPTEGCAPLTVQFTNESPTNASTFEWSFPGGNPASSTDENPSVTYANAGTYSATLIASNAAGSDTLEIQALIAVNDIPQAGFTVTTNGLNADFTNTSTNAGSYLWDFGDGGTSIETDPSHIYAADGAYTVTLTATNGCGSDMSEQTVSIVTPPTAGFTADPTSGCAPLMVQFASTSSANATGFLWDFPGGNPASSTEENPVVVYSGAGTFDVTLTVSNAAGQDSETQTGLIQVGGPPDAAFTPQIDAYQVHFQNNSVGALSYAWDFGDGQTSTESGPDHTYTADGTYTVTLTAQNACGEDVVTQTVSISNLPVANFSADNHSGCAPLAVQFDNLSSSNAVSYEWSFPGGNPSGSAEENPLVTYPAAGTYAVTLIAINPTGNDTITVEAFIEVFAVPQAQASNTGPYCAGDPISLNANAVAGASYAWTGPGGYASSEQNPSDAFEAGDYTLVITANGCASDPQSTTVVVNAYPFPAAGGDQAVCGLETQLAAVEGTGNGGWSLESGPGSIFFDDAGAADAIVTVSEPGAYTLLWTESSEGCEASDAVEIIFTAIPQAQASNGGPYCEGDQIQLFANDVPVAAYSWTGPGGYASGQQNPVDAGEPGDYQLVVAVGGCSSEPAITQVIVNSYPTPNAGEDQAVCGLSAQLAAVQSIGSGIWSLDSGPGAVSFDDPALPDAAVTVSESGAYSFTWTENNSGCEDSDGMQIVFTASPEAQASNGGPYCEGEQIELFANEVPVAAYAWTGPGGYVSGQQNPMDATEAGTYTLVITLNNCSSAPQSTEVDIDFPPAASFTAAVDVSTVTFTNTSTGGNSYLWNFGDGQTSEEENPVHEYSEDGIYVVILTVTNGCGSQSFTGQVEIVSPVTASFNSDMQSGCAPLTVQFSDQSDNNVTAWQWTFAGGDPASSTEQNPVVTYADPGVYDVQLEVSNSQYSDLLVKTGYITVEDVPEAGFTVLSDDLTATFTNTSQNADSWLWNFGDDETSTESDPVHTYQFAGAYLVTLVATNECGSDTTTQEIDIISGTNEHGYLSSLRLYPNPGDGLFTLDMEGGPSEWLEISLFDLPGSRIYAESVDFSAGRLHRVFDFRGLPKGVYVLKLQAERGNWNLRVVVN